LLIYLAITSTFFAHFMFNLLSRIKLLQPFNIL